MGRSRDDRREDRNVLSKRKIAESSSGRNAAMSPVESTTNQVESISATASKRSRAAEEGAKLKAEVKAGVKAEVKREAEKSEDDRRNEDLKMLDTISLEIECDMKGQDDSSDEEGEGMIEDKIQKLSEKVPSCA